MILDEFTDNIETVYSVAVTNSRLCRWASYVARMKEASGAFSD